MVGRHTKGHRVGDPVPIPTQMPATSSVDPPRHTPSIIGGEGLQALIDALDRRGYTVIGTVLRDGALVLEPIHRVDALPAGWTDEQEAGRYRLRPDGDGNGNGAKFAVGLGPQAWKRFLYPPTEVLWRARRDGHDFVIEEDDEAAEPRYAFLGVRACDLAAMDIQERVFDREGQGEPRAVRRRREAFIVATPCTRAGGTCFCASMGTGPAVDEGFDLALTETIVDGSLRYVVDEGSTRGAEVLAEIDRRPATAAETEEARGAVEETRANMGRQMVPDVAALLSRNLEHPQWESVAERCLACGNCTLVCPTCFCASVDDEGDLSGETTARVRRWDSCFTLEFSYVHGGSIRRATAARYRQWITHKLSSWQEQFGTSGCVGCGRCITWCPVGIDITAEARAIGDRDGEGG